MKLYQDDDNGRHLAGMSAANDPSFKHVYFHFPLGSLVEDPTEEERDKSKEIAEAPDAMTGVNTETGSQIRFIMRPHVMVTAKDPRPPLNWALSAASRKAIANQIEICGPTVSKQLASMLKTGLHRVAIEAVEDWRDCWSDSEDNQRAIDGCTRVLARTDQDDTHLAWARDFRATVYMMQEDYEKARDDYSALIAHDPKDAMRWAQRCTARVGVGENDLAVADCSEALRLDPGFAWAYIKRGQVYHAQKKYREALADFDAALRGNSNDAVARLNTAIALYARGLTKKELGDDAGAAEDAARAQHFEPNVPTFFGEQRP
jgi:tetratricopeptide (TPR) repeat protein